MLVTQKHIIKIIYGEPRDYPTDMLLTDSKISRISQSYYLEIIKVTYLPKRRINTDYKYCTRMNSKKSCAFP